MKISIIIPAYNVERFLALCLDSVLAQTYSDWEALLIDDGSTDSTPAICDEYGKRDERIRVWHKKNEGLSDTRQFGLSFVTGEYVLCLDSDDCIHPEYLERAAAHVDGEHRAVIWMGYQYVPEDFTEYRGGLCGKTVLDGDCQEMAVRKENSPGKGNREKRDDQEKDDGEKAAATGDGAQYACRNLTPIQAIRSIDEDEKDDIDRVSACVVWGKLYPAELFEAVSFPKGVRLHEDQRINHRLFALAERIIYDPAPVYFYRTREQSLIRKSWRRERLYIIECYQDRLDCVKEYAGTKEGTRLIELVYRRLLICIIRNYAQMRGNLRGQERRSQSRRLTALYRQLWRDNKEIKLPANKKPVLNLFRVSPRAVAWMFRIRG